MVKTLKIACVLIFLCKMTFANDSLSIKKSNKKLYYLVGSEAMTYTAGYIGLSYLWYSGFPRSSFHLFNDQKEWLQMDKFGHCFSTYWIARSNFKLLQWADASDNVALWGGIASSWLFISTIEVFDGF